MKNSFLTYFTNSWTDKEFSETYVHKLIESLRSKDFENFFIILRSIFANIDYDLHIPQEKYYQTIFYLIFTLIGLRVSAEVLVLSGVEAKTNVGRIDAVIEDRGIFLFEFKFSGTKEEALAQIKKNKYFEKYLSPPVETHSNPSLRGLYLFGVEFKDRNVGEWVMEEMQQ